MLTPAQFLQATGWFAIGTLAFGLITAIAFWLKWGFRFRLVGATGFMGVLTAGLFGLSFEPFTQASIPGAIAYTTVFDSGASQVVIAVPSTINATELEATLQQAASNLFKPNRISGSGSATPSIRARAIAHRGGISELLYLGRVTPAGNTQNAPVVEIYPDQLTKANQTANQSATQS
jgi:hypothetical protein